MKIGFYGALANNTYVAAKAFARIGVEVLYIHQEEDIFPFSQPMWEDIEFTLPYEQVQASSWSAMKWLRYGEHLKWKSPHFYRASSSFPPQVRELPLQQLPLLQRLIFRLLYVHQFRNPWALLELLCSCDFLIVCGVQATIMAYVSDKPYVIWPHGSDIRLAAGIGYKLNWWPKGWLAELRRWLLKQAYNQALFIGSHDPLGIGGHLGAVEYPIRYFPIPLPRHKKPEQAQRLKILSTCFDRFQLSVPLDKVYLFIPSRIDYYWKGTDRLINAIKTIRPTNLHFIFSGWGGDYKQAKLALADIPKIATFLPCSLSKPLLYQMFTSVDLVIDQFLLGSYGTSAVEAMSCGSPVMMYINEKAFLEKGWLPPPVINVSSEQDIRQALTDLDVGNLDLDVISQNIQKWFALTHEESVAVPNVMKQLHASTDK